jgi:hypothetical protein
MPLNGLSTGNTILNMQIINYIIKVIIYNKNKDFNLNGPSLKNSKCFNELLEVCILLIEAKRQ